jgi:biotin carboxyl carrier protein
MITDPFHIAVNGHHEFNFLPEDAKNLDLVAEAGGIFHLIRKGRTYRVELLEADYATRQYTCRINGNRYTLKISDHYERLIRQLGLHASSGQKVNTVKAPMPGLVIQIMATPGQAVQKGDPLLILEAMKMENVIKAAGDGQVKTLHVQKGSAVEKGHLLIEME